MKQIQINIGILEFKETKNENAKWILNNNAQDSLTINAPDDLETKELMEEIRKTIETWEKNRACPESDKKSPQLTDESTISSVANAEQI